MLDPPAQLEHRYPAWSTTPSAVTYLQQKLPVPTTLTGLPFRQRSTTHASSYLSESSKTCHGRATIHGSSATSCTRNKEKSLLYCPKRTLLSFTFANSPLFSTQGAFLPHNGKHAPTQPNSSRLEHAARCITMPVNSRSSMFESSLAMPPRPSHFVEHKRFP